MHPVQPLLRASPPPSACPARRSGVPGVAVGSLALVLGLSLAPDLEGGAANSTHYTRLQATLDAGGGVVNSAHYQLVSSIGLSGGLVRSRTDLQVDRQGFVASLNDPPLPRADTFHRTPGQPGKVHRIALLANDQDPENDPLEWLGFDTVTDGGGRVTYDNGWLLYQPPDPAPETDTFTYRLGDQAGNVARTYVTVLLAGTGLDPSRNLMAIWILPRGHVRVAFAGIAGRFYRIEWTDRLPATRWETLALVQADARGVIEWVDTTEPAPPQRYYRTADP